MIVDTLLLNPDDTEAMGETGVFGGVASGAVRTGQRAVYELLNNTSLVSDVLTAPTSDMILAAFTIAASTALTSISAEDPALTGVDQLTGIWLTGIIYVPGGVDLEIRINNAGAAPYGTTISLSYNPAG